MASLRGARIAAPIAAGAICIVFAGVDAARAADPVSDFYAGKTISVNIGFSAGGGFDLYARTVTRHMMRHVPGAPKVVARQMPGAGSFRAAQFMATAAPQDGTQLATVGQSIPLQQAMQDPNATFDVRKFAWIGNPINGVSTIGFWSESGVRTLEDARSRELTVGATGHNVTMQYPLGVNELLGTKFKVILGYPGGNDIELAMERREVDGKGQFSWSTLKSTKRDWLRDRKVNLILQLGSRKEPEISQYMGYDVPLASEIVKTEEDRMVIDLLTSGEVVGRPLLTTPGVPAERVNALRRAFDATMKDAELLSEAEKLGLEIDPINGEDLQAAVERILSAKPAAVERLQAILRRS
ncbi:MAG: hypothetical protein K2Y29_14370 [Beijerinckiaceae bacterium]|nr:hypothetical protein [Beijerinckiaceae bacterium]